jgi:erythromycin 3''-O-methyltransferase
VPTALVTGLFSDTANLYDVLGRQPGTDHFLNLGWWTDELRAESTNEEIITEACRELVRQFAQFGDLQPEDRILDVGFGFAQQDVLLAREFDCRNIIGINITPYHVKKGRELLREENVDDRVKLHIGDAVNLPYPENHFNKIFALETAFHFHTREDFFKEAKRVLRPGGTLLTADIIDGPRRTSMNSAVSTMLATVHETYWNIPSDNRTDQQGYHHTLADKGFSKITLRDVSDQVLHPWVDHYLKWRVNQQPRLFNWMGQAVRRTITRFYQQGSFRYIFARASTPKT